jgi:hypothetical protein
MAEKQWCPGCSREVEGVCHHFNCAIGPNGLDAQSRSSAGSTGPLPPCPLCRGNNITEGVFYAEGSSIKEGAVRCATCGCRAPMAAWMRAAAQSAPCRNERSAFIAAHQHLDLTEIKDAWGAPMFQHSHVDAMWSGWKAHALSLAAQPPAAPVETLDALVEKITPENLHQEFGLECSSAGNSEPAEVEEDDPDVLTAARAIAEHGFGRPWDDFHVSNAFDTDQNDLIEYGRAAVSALRSRALPQTPSTPEGGK